jgi:hypothetical protein
MALFPITSFFTPAGGKLRLTCAEWDRSGSLAYGWAGLNFLNGRLKRDGRIPRAGRSAMTAQHALVLDVGLAVRAGHTSERPEVLAIESVRHLNAGRFHGLS